MMPLQHLSYRETQYNYFLVMLIMFNCIKITTYSTSHHHCWRGLEINISKMYYNGCTPICFLGAIHCNKHSKFEPALQQQEPLIQSCQRQYFKWCPQQTLVASTEGAAYSSCATQEREARLQNKESLVTSALLSLSPRLYG